MTIATLFTKSAPTISGVEFDAILEDTLELEVSTTGYPIESGARASDHAIVEPYRWQLVGAVSNNPLKPVVTDFVGALGLNGALSGLAAGLLSDNDNTRNSTALKLLTDLTIAREPFDIDAGDISLSNMIIVKLSRVKTAETENGLIFVAQLQELPTLETLLSDRTIKQSQLLDGDPSKSQLSELIDKGEKLASDAGESIREVVGGIFG